VIWKANVSRVDLLALSQNEEPVARVHRVDVPLPDLDHLNSEATAIWDANPDGRWDLPRVLIIRDAERQDFFAWANSFLKMSPVTAFVRVLTYPKVKNLIINRIEPGQRLRAPFVALALCEALGYLEEDHSRLTLRACEATYSFAVAKSFLHVFGDHAIAQTGFDWFRARQLLNSRTTSVTLQELQSIWIILTELVTRSSISRMMQIPEPVLRGCFEIVELGRISKPTWIELTREHNGIPDVQTFADSTREDRVLAFERAVRSFAAAQSSSTSAFIAGYLCSQIGPGSLEHWRLLRGVKRELPSAILWYGLCAGLQPNSQMAPAFSGLGRLVAREIDRKIELLSAPTCEVSIEELDSLGGFNRIASRMNVSSTTTIALEIAPGITIPMRPGNVGSPLFDTAAEPKIGADEIRDLVQQIDGVARRLQEIKHDAMRIVDPSLPLSGRSRSKRKRQDA
jgi:hypothetical protein